MAVKLGIIADDMTGALDTGARLAARGARVYVSRNATVHGMDVPTDVMVLNTGSRHMPPGDAYDAVYGAAAALRAWGAEAYYKKTDSVLRGNIGAELAALADALDGSVCFVPAYPAQNRVTINGVQYVDGIPADQSHAARDPMNPVESGYIPDIIAAQTDKTAVVLRKPYDMPDSWADITVLDAKCEDDLHHIKALLEGAGRMRLTAGCAGFAAYLDAAEGAPREPEPLCGPALVICGSINPVTLGQLAHAERTGYAVHQPDEADACAAALNARGAAVLASRGYNGARPLDALVCAASDVVAAVRPGVVMVIGGDTLLAHMRAEGIEGMTPVGEPFPGAPLSETARGPYVTRSGGFGGEDALSVFVDWARGRRALGVSE